MSHTAFFYGTLMAPPVLHRVAWGSETPPTPAHASLLSVRPAILHHYRRHRVKGADYPAIIRAPAKQKSSVRGTLVTGLTDGDIWRLDIFEGSEYKREKVEVKILQASNKSARKDNNEQGMGDLQQKEEDNIELETVAAEAYVWIAGTRHLEPNEWDFSEFVRDKMDRWLGREAADMDEGFQGRPSINDVDDAVAALQKDPTGGRGANGDISRQLESGGKKEESLLNSAV